jgi:hypothetical protein
MQGNRADDVWRQSKRTPADAADLRAHSEPPPFSSSQELKSLAQIVLSFMPENLVKLVVSGRFERDNAHTLALSFTPATAAAMSPFPANARNKARTRWVRGRVTCLPLAGTLARGSLRVGWVLRSPGVVAQMRLNAQRCEDLGQSQAAVAWRGMAWHTLQPYLQMRTCTVVPLGHAWSRRPLWIGTRGRRSLTALRPTDRQTRCVHRRTLVVHVINRTDTS